jgi:PTH1 family peptidyl-tRNA hydrolase
MKLVVGLGNPGRRYENTRHNVGYLVLDELGRRFGVGAPKTKFHAAVLDASLSGQPALLVRPETYMNLSGTSVHEVQTFYKVPLEDLLVVCDDLNLPLGRLRCRTEGSSGGQKGLEDIIRRLGADAIPRLRIGIGQPASDGEWVDFVLSKFTRQEMPEIEEAIGRAADAVADWAKHGIQYCMNHYNKGC